ncbi:MAG: transporter [Paracoccus aminovorans]|nr:transporter [Paracoccus aminovorans]
MTQNSRAFRALRLAAAAMLMTTAQGHAVEFGATITPFGVMDFGAGMLPPPTPHGTWGLRLAYYSSDRLQDSRGDTIANGFDISVKTYGLAYLRMTDHEIWGARYGFSAVIPVMDLNARMTVPTPAGPLGLQGSELGLGDVQIVPVMLQWAAPPNLFVNAMLQIQAPTGDFDAKAPFNIGTNHWTISPMVGLTWISDGGFEVSTQTMVNFNTENKDTHYTSGIEWKQEFAVGQHVGDWTVGMAGYVYQQLTDDDGPGVIDGNRARGYALGPAVSFLRPGMPMLSLHAYKEFGARNRPEGVNVALRSSISF